MVGARNTVDKERVLQAAEAIVAERGAAALTIDAVANAAGITKGGVQSSFGTKDALVCAMVDRWLQDDSKRFERLLGSDNPSVLKRTLAHVKTTRMADDASQARVASLMVSVLQSVDHRKNLRHWYSERLAGLDVTLEHQQMAMVAFLATEGAFFLKFFGLVDFDQKRWDILFDKLEALVTSMD